MSALAHLPPMADAAQLRRAMSEGVTLFYIGHRLGHAGRTERWLRGRVDWLTQHANFPAPLPSPKATERRYSRRAVDEWFDARLPPSSPSVLGDESPMAAILDARAAGLHLMGES